MHYPSAVFTLDGKDSTVIDIVDPYCDPESGIDENGIYHFHSRFDWCDIGGRWSDFIISENKNGEEIHSNSALVSEINFEKMEKEYKYKFYIYHFLLPDGNWIGDYYEPVTNEQIEEVLKKAKQNNWYMTILDCHI